MVYDRDVFSAVCRCVLSVSTQQPMTARDNFIQPLQFFDEHGQNYTVEPTDPQFEFYLERMKTQVRTQRERKKPSVERASGCESGERGQK
jgi:hypothetical protein